MCRSRDCPSCKNKWLMKLMKNRACQSVVRLTVCLPQLLVDTSLCDCPFQQAGVSYEMRRIHMAHALSCRDGEQRDSHAGVLAVLGVGGSMALSRIMGKKTPTSALRACRNLASRV